MDNLKFTQELENFEKWLVKNCELSPKVARDTKSRVNRVQKNICSSLNDVVNSKDDYLKLLAQIKIYAIENSTSKRGQYTLSGSLTSAVRKYTIFKNPKMSKSLPSAHGSIVRDLVKSYQQ